MAQKIGPKEQANIDARERNYLAAEEARKAAEKAARAKPAVVEQLRETIAQIPVKKIKAKKKK